MKKILGLDIGTTSIGWARVNEAENPHEKSSIVDASVRLVPLTADEQNNFDNGKKGETSCAQRTLRRGMRRNLQRYKLRRERLKKVLKEHGLLREDGVLPEVGRGSTFQILRLRAQAAREKISLEDFSRVLLKINKKRGYKSNRKAKQQDEGQAISGNDIAKELFRRKITPGQFVSELFSAGKTFVPDFYPSDLKDEFDKIWNSQQRFYPAQLTPELKKSLAGKSGKAVWAICKEPWGLVGMKRQTKGQAKKQENYAWRVQALSEKIDLEQLAIVLQEISGEISASGNYLAMISDRSKQLLISGKTIGEHQLEQLARNSRHCLKNEIYYRQDYLDEFEKIWETQAKFYPNQLTPSLKKIIRDEIIFFQRPLRSQKSSVDICQLERKEIEIEQDGKKTKKVVGQKVCPASSLLFQEFRIWQQLNNLVLTTDANGLTKRELSSEEKGKLLDELQGKIVLKKTRILSLLKNGNEKIIDLNFEELHGNETAEKIRTAVERICERCGDVTPEAFAAAHPWAREILEFDSGIEDRKMFQQQGGYAFWHLLYSVEDENSLRKLLKEKFGIEEEFLSALANLAFEEGFSNLCAKAIKKILPHMKRGMKYSEACAAAGYAHSVRSRTAEELRSREYKTRLEILPKNSLRNKKKKKILNQMIHVVNGVVEVYGELDEIRIELARELKKNAEERKKMTADIRKNETRNAEIAKKIQAPPFNVAHPSKNDIIRYRLYEELEPRGWKTLYSDTYIRAEELFSKKFQIEHILPKAKIFDDSFSNKTLELHSVNLEKGNKTAFDFIAEDKKEAYGKAVVELFEKGAIGKGKRDRLMMREQDIPQDFIERDLRNTQYIARKARELLEDIVPVVTATTGSVTARLREDWQIVNVMQEINWDKYDALGLTETLEKPVFDENNRPETPRRIPVIKNWTKRNDHRHHAMDAITIAFTKPCYIKYLNNLNAKSRKDGEIYAIEQRELYTDNSGGQNSRKKKFRPPFPLDEFRASVKEHLQKLLVSIKAKNKVVTKNKNKARPHESDATQWQTCLTPRGELHRETVYGKREKCFVQEEKVGASFDREKILSVCKPLYREALLRRLEEFGGDAAKAFSGKNAPAKKPIWLNEDHTLSVPDRVKVYTPVLTTRKEISSELNIDAVVDAGIRKILRKRIAQYGGDAKKALDSLDSNPLWLNEEKKIAIRKVRIRVFNDGIPLRGKRDVFGNAIRNAAGTPAETDFVQTSNNHHVAFYLDELGKVQERVVSFFEATSRAIGGQPIVDKNFNAEKGWKFLFTMKQNECFLFPNEAMEFSPKEWSAKDLKNPKNYAKLAPNLFRVQKISKGDYHFRHIFETTVNENRKELKDIAYKRCTNLSFVKHVVKIRISHIGKIVDVGEY